VGEKWDEKEVALYGKTSDFWPLAVWENEPKSAVSGAKSPK